MPTWILDAFVIATRFAAIALVLVGIVTLARDGGLRLLGTVVMSIVISWGLMALLEIGDTTSVRSVVNLDDLGARHRHQRLGDRSARSAASLPLSPQQRRG